MVSIAHSCNHSCLDHFFRAPNCEQLAVWEKIGIIVFHIITLCIPLIIYYLFSCCSRASSLRGRQVAHSSTGRIDAKIPLEMNYKFRSLTYGIYGSYVIEHINKLEETPEDASLVKFLVEGLEKLKEDTQNKPLPQGLNKKQEEYYNLVWENNEVVVHLINDALPLLQRYGVLSSARPSPHEPSEKEYLNQLLANLKRRLEYVNDKEPSQP